MKRPRPIGRPLLFEPLERRQLLTAVAEFELSDLLVANGGDGTQGVVLKGVEELSLSGDWVRSAGDVNGDGFDDIMISGSRAGDPMHAGESYVVYGKPTGFAAEFDLSTLLVGGGAAGFVLAGSQQRNSSGYTLDGAGDVNGDGLDDMIIGTISSPEYVVFGRRDPVAAEFPLSSLLPENGGDGTRGFVLAGYTAATAVSGAGDLNGDGIDDLVIGSRTESLPGIPFAGKTYVVFGREAGFPAKFELESLRADQGGDGTEGFFVTGLEENDYLGLATSGAGDLNGDGIDDLVISAATRAPTTKSGESYVLFGRLDGFPPHMDISSLFAANGGDGSTGFVLHGIAPGDRSGQSVANAGDVNGDGFDDLIIGSLEADSPVDNEGQSYLVFGRQSGFPAELQLEDLLAANGGDGSAGFAINGIDPSDLSGNTVAAAGDVNADGFDDIIIGAFGAEADNGNGEGETYLLFGRPGPYAAEFELSTLLVANGGTGLAGIVFRGIDRDDSSGSSASGAGDVNGDGFDDLIIGAPSADQASGLEGESYLIFGRDFTSHVTHQGEAGADNLVGDALANVIVGGRGDDSLSGNGGADVLRGAQGDDVLVVADANFRRLDGGSGSDTLRFEEPGGTLDLTLIADNRITGVEAIDVSGNGGNMLILDAREILNLSSTSNTVIVRHDKDDKVEYGPDWIVDVPDFFASEYRHVLRHAASSGVIQVVNTRAWQNPWRRFDVNRDGQVTPNDILRTINTINDDGPRLLPAPVSPSELPTNYYDVNGDGFVTANDVLVGINFQNSQPPSSEGEATGTRDVADETAFSFWLPRIFTDDRQKPRVGLTAHSIEKKTVERIDAARGEPSAILSGRRPWPTDATRIARHDPEPDDLWELLAVDQAKLTQALTGVR